MQKKSITKGILLAFLTSVISGVAIFYSKISLAKIPPLILTSSRNFYVGILFLLLFLFSGKLKELKKLTKKQLLNLSLIGIIGGTLPFYLFFSGLQTVEATSANLIQKSLFIWVTILAVIFLKEKINIWYLVSFVLIAAANYFFGKLNIGLGTGEIMIFSATLLWGVENILAKKVLKNVSSELVGLFRMGIGGSLLMLTTLLTNKATFISTIQQPVSPAGGYNNITIILTGGTILFFYVFTWYKALKYAPASLVTLILTFSVVVGNILSGSFAGVKLLPKDIYSSVFIAAAALVILWQTNVFPYLMRKLFNSQFPQKGQ